MREQIGSREVEKVARLGNIPGNTNKDKCYTRGESFMAGVVEVLI